MTSAATKSVAASRFALAQIPRQRRLGVIDRLVLADHAAQVVRDIAGARLKHRVGQNLSDLHGMRGHRAEKRQRHHQNPDTPVHFKPSMGNHSAGCANSFAAGFGAPIRNLRSDNESAPPIAITKAPSQIKSTSGLW